MYSWSDKYIHEAAGTAQYLAVSMSQ